MKREKEEIFRTYKIGQATNIIVVSLPLVITLFVLVSKWDSLHPAVWLFLILVAVSLGILELIFIRVYRILVIEGVDGITADDIEWYRAQKR